MLTSARKLEVNAAQSTARPKMKKKKITKNEKPLSINNMFMVK